MENLDKYSKTFKQGDVTKGQIEGQLILNFKFRPAGWAANDGCMVYPIRQIYRIILALLSNVCILKGDESVSFEAQWKRPKTDWQKIDLDN